MLFFSKDIDMVLVYLKKKIKKLALFKIIKKMLKVLDYLKAKRKGQKLFS